MRGVANCLHERVFTDRVDRGRSYVDKVHEKQLLGL